MKKIIAMLLALVMVLALAACGGDEAKETGNGTSSESTPVENQGGNAEQTEPEAQNPTSGELTAEILDTYPETPISEFTYSASLDYEGYMIDSYNGDDEVVVIPAQIDGYDVVQVSKLCFGNDSTVKAVKIPDTVVRLSGVFANNDDIEVVIARGVEEIGDFTFGNCYALRELVLGDSLRYFDEYAFSGCSVLEKLYISPAVQDLTEQEYGTAFFGCSSLTIYGEAGSFIEGVCQELDIPFVAE